MIKPTIHLNGSGAEHLLEGYTEAATAVFRALEKVGHCGPNARDYYPQGPSAFESARAEHVDRMRRLHKVLDELNALERHVADERDRRKRP